MPKPLNPRNRAWDDSVYVKAADLARKGCKNQKIAKILGVAPPTFKRWLKEKPALREALRDARTPKESKGETFREYVYNRLPENLQELWDNIADAEGQKNSVSRIESMLANAGEDARKRLLVHALVNCNFNLTRALSKVNVSRRQFDRWALDDPDFGDMLNQIEEWKVDFFEDALFDLVRDRHPSAVIFALQTKGSHRGYGRKVKVEGEVNHSGVVTHGVVGIEELSKYLSLDDRRRMLEALRKAKDAAIPVEYRAIEDKEKSLEG